MTNSNFFIVGKHAVTEALKNSARKVIRVFLTEESKKSINRENQDKNLLKNVKVENFSYLYKTDGILHIDRLN